MGDEHVEVSAGEFVGRFHRFEKKLGRGATKKVFLAYDTERGVDCAWNQISLDSLTEEEQEGLEKEINVMKSLDHANILKYHAHWKTPDFLCFITDYQTHSLKNYINERKIRLSTVKNWSRQILSGLAHLHQRKILHRDIKCDNLFLNSQNSTVVIGDLGLAKEMTKATGVNGEPMSIVGTPQFMAPEQLHLQTHYDEKVDIYALGMCIIEMITRTYPYAECRTILEVITCINEQRDCLALTRIKSQNSSSFIQWCCHRNPECRPGALDALKHVWLCRTTAEDNKYCQDLVAPDESSMPRPDEVQPGPANADVPLKPKQIWMHESVDTGPAEDSPRPAVPEGYGAVSPPDAARPTVAAPIQPTAHSANLNTAIQTPAVGIANQSSQVGNQQFPANSQPNHNAFSQYVQPVFNQPPQMGGFMNPMAMPNFNPMMYMNMNPGMNTVVPPQMVQQFMQMTQNSAPNSNLDPRMLENWLQQMFQAQATANFMNQQWMQQQFSQFMQQQGLPVSSTPVHPTSNGTSVPSTPLQGANTNPITTNEPRLSTGGKTPVPVPNPIQAPATDNPSALPQFTTNGTLEGPSAATFSQPGSATSTPQPSYNTTPNQAFPNSFSNTYATPQNQPAQFKQAPSSNNQQQYQNPNPTQIHQSPNPPQIHQNPTPPTAQPNQTQFQTPANQAPFQPPPNQTPFQPPPSTTPATPYKAPTATPVPYNPPNNPPPTQQPAYTQPANSTPNTQPHYTPNPNQSQFIQPYTQPAVSANATSAPQQQYQNQNMNPNTPQFTQQQGPFRSEPQVQRKYQSFSTNTPSISGSVQSSTSHSPSNSPQVHAPPSANKATNPARHSLTSEASTTGTKNEKSNRKKEFENSKDISLNDPVKVVSVELTDQGALYYVLRIWNPGLGKKKFGITVQESDDVNKIIQQLLEDKNLPLEWHDRVHFALTAAKELLDQPQMTSSRSEPAFQTQEAVPAVGDISRHSSAHHVPSLDKSNAPSDDGRSTVAPIPVRPVQTELGDEEVKPATLPPVQVCPPQVKRRRSSPSMSPPRAPPRAAPILQRNNSAPLVFNERSDPDPTHMSKAFFQTNHHESPSDAILHANQPSLVSSNINRAHSEFPSQPLHSTEAPPEGSKADPARTPQRIDTLSSRTRGDVNTIEDDLPPSPPLQYSPPDIPFDAYPTSQDELYKRIIYMSRGELLNFCDIHSVTNEGIPIAKDIDDNTLKSRVFDHILAKRGEKRKPSRRKKTKKKEKENEKPKTKRIQSCNTPVTKDEREPINRRGSEPVLNSLTRAKPEVLPPTNNDAPAMALNPEMERLGDKSDEDTGLITISEPEPDSLLEETNKKDQTQSLCDSILELHQFMQISGSQNTSDQLKRMMLANLEQLKAHDVSKYEDLTREMDFSQVITPERNVDPFPPERITRPCSEVEPNSSDSDSFFIAMAYSLTQIGISPEVTAIEIRKRYIRELQAIINHDDSSAEKLSRHYQKVRNLILRMYNESTEQALSRLEEFANPGFWNQHLFDNTGSIMAKLWSIRIVLYQDGFDEDEKITIGKGTDLTDIEIFQERIYEDGVPAFVYRIVDTETVKQPLNFFDVTQDSPFMSEIINDLLSKQEKSAERRRLEQSNAKPKLMKKNSGGSGTGGSNTPKESPKKPEPIEPLMNDDPSDPFQNITRSLMKSSTNSLQRIESIESSGMSAKADDSPNDSPNKSTEPLDIMPEEVPKEKAKPKLTKEQKEQRKLEKARKRAEIEARIAEEQQRLQEKPPDDTVTLQAGTRV